MRRNNGQEKRWGCLSNHPGQVAILDVGNNLCISDANERFLKELGYTIEEFEQEDISIRDLVAPEDGELFEAYYFAVEQQNEEPQPPEIRLIDKQGVSHWYELLLNAQDCKMHDAEYLSLLIWNVDKKKKLEDDIRIQMERYDLVKDLSNEFIFEYDIENDSFVLPTDMIIRRGIDTHEKKEVTCCEFEAMVHPEDWKLFDERIRKPDAGNVNGMLEYRLNVAKIGKSPKFQWFRTFYKKILGSSSEVIRVIGRTINIQNDREKIDEMELKVRQDSMTGMLNKNAVEKEIRAFFDAEPSGTHALIMVDIDDFKHVNDCFGHLYGDEILKDVARKIMERFRNTDLVGRVGGDEFLICMKNATPELALSVGEEICELTKICLRTENGDIQVSCSVGICMYPYSAREYTELFKRAEIAMYTSKQEGKSKVKVFDHWTPELEMGQQFANRSEMSEYRMSMQTDAEFLTTCFEMLADARDLEASLNMLIQHIGKRYNLGGVAVLKYDRDFTHAIRVNKWTIKEGIYTLPAREFPNMDNQDCLSFFDENNRICIDDVLTADFLTDTEKQEFMEDDVRACVYAGFKHSDFVRGVVAYQSVGRPRKWSEGEKHFFSEFARVVAVFIALKDKQEQDKSTIANLKKHDHVTGMLTEDAFIKQVNEYCNQMDKKENLVVANLDIEGFAYVNENFGTAAGNELLRELARVFQFPDRKVICCRQFSDYFSCFFADCTMEEAEGMINDVENEFMEHVKGYYPNSAIRLSTGLYEWNEDVPIQYAVENANMARKAVKRHGSQRMMRYNGQMRESRVRNRLVASQFHEALADNRFFICLQPKFDLRTMEVVGAECLSRWEQPEGNVMPPQVFMESLEHIGYITELDFFAYEETLKLLAAWGKKGYHRMPVSVNFSRKHFDNAGIYPRVKALADQYGVPHNLVEIELTESLLSERMEHVVCEMEALRKDGFLVDIDDFGTGYSSLSMLLEVPVDVIKIDKSFVKFNTREDMKTRREFMTLLSRMMQTIDTRVVCEGVETKEQARILMECGFGIGQGYLCDPPMEVTDFEKKYLEKMER